jgi:hypothetical protein
MSVAVTPTVVQDIVDDVAERELWIVGKEHERPPYFHVGKGGDTRLARALRLCIDGRITPNSDGSYTVEGSEGRTYRVGDSCSCPQSQKAQSRWCYHAVAVAVYVEWQRRLRPLQPLRAPLPAPVALGTLRAGTMPLPHDDEALGNGYPVDDETLPLPLPPTTVDERLAAAVDQCVTHALQEDRMADDDDGYIPEPERVSTAILEPPVATRALTPVAQEDDLEQALTRWTAQRQIVQRFLKHQLIAGTDYYQLRIGKGESKPSLSKAGAEKVLSWLKWSASFTPDTGTWEMLGRPTNLVCYVCHLHTRSGEVVGEGRGARSVTKDNGDINKAIKMAEKSSMVSAVLRTGALSDCFTQDLEDMQEPEPAKPTTSAKPTAADLRQRIWAKVQELAPDVKTREAVEAYIKEHTGMTLHPDLYEAIATRLYEGGR